MSRSSKILTLILLMCIGWALMELHVVYLAGKNLNKENKGILSREKLEEINFSPGNKDIRQFRNNLFKSDNGVEARLAPAEMGRNHTHKFGLFSKSINIKESNNSTNGLPFILSHKSNLINNLQAGNAGYGKTVSNISHTQNTTTTKYVNKTPGLTSTIYKHVQNEQNMNQNTRSKISTRNGITRDSTRTETSFKIEHNVNNNVTDNNLEEINLGIKNIPVIQRFTAQSVPANVPSIRVLDFNVRKLNFDPSDPGENGAEVHTEKSEQEKVWQGFKAASFNQYVSDKISLERSIPDTRDSLCRTKKYQYAAFPKVSVIICFTEETPSALLRSLYSVINRTPPILLEEILLVDDFSKREDLGKSLEDELKKFPKVRLIRLKERHGLVRARLVAVKEARSAVLVFLDSHIECNKGWLEPLLEVIYRSKGQSVASPLIDLINPETLSYLPTQDDVRGGFTWSLEFRWKPIPAAENRRRVDRADTILSPAMAGGLFAIYKQLFNTLGGYDPGLEVWGSENLELSFKVWMCGGRLEIVPCSRVGHTFRATQPYKFLKHNNVETFLRNNIRVAEVWMDEYKEVFYTVFPQLRNWQPSNITTQIRKRRSMNCQSFKWYLENVYPELHIPALHPLAGNGLRTGLGNICLNKAPLSNQPIGQTMCHSSGGHQHFQLTTDGRVETLEECVGLQDGKLHGVDCSSSSVLRFNYTRPAWDKWDIVNDKDKKTFRVLIDRFSGKCVTVSRDSVVLETCKDNHRAQLWTFLQHFDSKLKT